MTGGAFFPTYRASALQKETTYIDCEPNVTDETRFEKRTVRQIGDRKRSNEWEREKITSTNEQ